MLLPLKHNQVRKNSLEFVSPLYLDTKTRVTFWAVYHFKEFVDYNEGIR